MSEEEAGPAIGEPEGSSPNRDDGDLGREGTAGDSAMKGGEPSPDRDAIDIEAVRDRAS